MQGKGFEAEVNEDPDGRWVVRRLRSPRVECCELRRVNRSVPAETGAFSCVGLVEPMISRPVTGDHSAVKLEVSVDDDCLREFPVDPLARGRAEPARFVGVFEQLEQAF